MEQIQQVGSSHLAVVARHREDFVPGELHAAGLVIVDVAGLGGHHPLVGLQDGVDDGDIGHRAAAEEEDVRIGRAAQVAEVIAVLVRGAKPVANPSVQHLPT